MSNKMQQKHSSSKVTVLSKVKMFEAYGCGSLLGGLCFFLSLQLQSTHDNQQTQLLPCHRIKDTYWGTPLHVKTGYGTAEREVFFHHHNFHVKGHGSGYHAERLTKQTLKVWVLGRQHEIVISTTGLCIFPVEIILISDRHCKENIENLQ